MNTEYKKLAYERAFFLAVARATQERFLPVEGAVSPEQNIECDDLPRQAAVVPPNVIYDGVLRFQRMAESRARQMSKFRFVAAKEENDEQEWNEAAPATKALEVKNSGSEVTAPSQQGKGKASKNAAQPTAGKPKPSAKAR